MSPFYIDAQYVLPCLTFLHCVLFSNASSNCWRCKMRNYSSFTSPWSSPSSSLWSLTSSSSSSPTPTQVSQFHPCNGTQMLHYGICSGRQMSRRRSSCVPQNVNALARPQLEKRQVIKVKLIPWTGKLYDLLALIFFLIWQNMRAAKTTMFMVTILLVCYLPLIVKWQVGSVAGPKMWFCLKWYHSWAAGGDGVYICSWCSFTLLTFPVLLD